MSQNCVANISKVENMLEKVQDLINKVQEFMVKVVFEEIDNLSKKAANDDDQKSNC